MRIWIFITSLGISFVDFTSIKYKDIQTCKKIKEKLESYDYKIISNKNLRKVIWKELFANINKIGTIEDDDIRFFYEVSLIPGFNIYSLYANLKQKDNEINNTYKICVDYCLNNKIIKNLIKNEIIMEDDWLEKEDSKELLLRKKAKNDKNINK